MKNHKQYHIVFCLLTGLTLLFSSCDKFLDIQPKGYTIPSTVEDYSRMLNDISLISYLSTDLDKMSDSFYLAGMTTNTITQDLDQRIYFWLPGMYTQADYQYNSPWQLCYAVIYQYNAIIENIDAATGGTEAEKNEIKASARTGRAIAYWYLVNLYASPYNAQTADSDLGVPIVLSASSLDASTLPARSSVSETYRFIITELNESIPDLPEISSSIYNLRQTVAYGFLARTYLYMADYENAIAMVNRVMETNSTLLNYNTIMTENSSGGYTFDETAFSPLENNPENTYALMYSYGYGMSYTQISNAYHQLFANNPNDLRNAFYSNTAYAEEYTDGTYTNMSGIYFSIGPAVPEMYLIRAECNARLGNTTEALTDLNTLRQNRILTSAYNDLQSGDSMQVMRWILEERQRELEGKGLRWFDMRRLNNDPLYGFTAHHYLQDGTTIDLEPNSPRYVLQIPDVALTADIVQNPL